MQFLRGALKTAAGFIVASVALYAVLGALGFADLPDVADWVRSKVSGPPTGTTLI